MTVIANLIEAQFIRVGTWIGVNPSTRAVVNRYVVDGFSSTGEIIATDIRTATKVKINHGLVAEVDGMRLDRFLQQADLDANGLKITGIKRRGRKPRVRT